VNGENDVTPDVSGGIGPIGGFDKQRNHSVQWSTVMSTELHCAADATRLETRDYAALMKGGFAGKAFCKTERPQLGDFHGKSMHLLSPL